MRNAIDNVSSTELPTPSPIHHFVAYFPHVKIETIYWQTYIERRWGARCSEGNVQRFHVQVKLTHTCIATVNISLLIRYFTLLCLIYQMIKLSYELISRKHVLRLL